jgi:hypothetical protein
MESKKKNEIGWWEMLRLRCFRPGVKTQDLADKEKKKRKEKFPPLLLLLSSPELLTWWLLEDGFLVTFSYPSSRQVEEKGKKGW